MYPFRLSRFVLVFFVLVVLAPVAAVSAAEESVGAAFAVAEQVGDPAMAGTIREMAGSSFLEGFQAACTTVGIVAIIGSMLAVRFLPSRTTGSVESLTSPSR